MVFIFRIVYRIVYNNASIKFTIILHASELQRNSANSTVSLKSRLFSSFRLKIRISSKKTRFLKPGFSTFQLKEKTNQLKLEIGANKTRFIKTAIIQ